MPYIITTTTERATARTSNGADLKRHERSGTRDVTRRAVAAFDEAREAVRDAIDTIGKPHERTYEWDAPLPESGGTVGPLPDGTVIEVAEMVNEFGRPDVRGYLRGWHFPASMGDAEIIDAYNAAQVA